MSDLLPELSLNAANLQTVSDAAMRALDLVPGAFAWFTAAVQYPMPPQRIIPDSTIEHTSYSSRITYYGGKVANGDWECGRIHANIPERLSGGATHQSGQNSFPHPYIDRLLTVNGGVITVDTPSVECSPSDGPVVTEGLGYNDRYRVVTKYDIGSGAVTVQSGRLITDGSGIGSWGFLRDETIETDAMELPTDILGSRLAIMLRTINGTTELFNRIVQGQASQMNVRITREYAH